MMKRKHWHGKNLMVFLLIPLMGILMLYVRNFSTQVTYINHNNLTPSLTLNQDLAGDAHIDLETESNMFGWENKLKNEIYGTWEVYRYGLDNSQKFSAIESGQLRLQEGQYNFVNSGVLTQSGLDALGRRLLFIREPAGQVECDWLQEEEQSISLSLPSSIIVTCLFSSNSQTQAFKIRATKIDENSFYLALVDAVEPSEVLLWSVEKHVIFTLE